MSGGIERLLEAFDIQRRICRGLGAPFYAELLRRCRADVEAGGAVYELVRDWEGDPLRGWLPLRVVGGVHTRVLAGLARDLARFYPSVGGKPEWPAAWQAFEEVLRTERDSLEASLDRVPQTNEVGRSASLLGGFLRIADQTRLPLRIRELGASAGLNLLWDRYSFVLGPHRYGPSGARVEIRSAWQGDEPALAAAVSIESRRGCDLAPIDVTDPRERERLLGYVWPDHVARLDRMRAALEAALESPPVVDRAPAAEWLERELASLAEGTATVVYHSSFWPYLDDDERSQLRGLIEAAGDEATRSAPLAWLRLEEAPSHVDLRLRTWPSGDDTLLAESHVHGEWIKWLA